MTQYITKVHVIDVVVWTTILSIDYAFSQTNFIFVLDMLLGNVASVLRGSDLHPVLRFPVLSLYWGLT